jgi:segregation and condensation protein A
MPTDEPTPHRRPLGRGPGTSPPSGVAHAPAGDEAAAPPAAPATAEPSATAEPEERRAPPAAPEEPRPSVPAPVEAAGHATRPARPPEDGRRAGPAPSEGPEEAAEPAEPEDGRAFIPTQGEATPSAEEPPAVGTEPARTEPPRTEPPRPEPPRTEQPRPEPTRPEPPHSAVALPAQAHPVAPPGAPAPAPAPGPGPALPEQAQPRPASPDAPGAAGGSAEPGPDGQHGGQHASEEAAAPEEAADPEESGGFTVRLVNFEGPFDLLLQLISKHKLDVTEVALSKVTDEFISYIRAMGPDWDLDQATSFLVVAATLLDLKAARLLPAAEVEDEEDLALLEARDLLFARLLQYRAYKQIAAIFAERWAEELRHHPRTVGLEPHHAELLPEVVISIGPEGFARLAAKAMVPKPKPAVYVEHIHAPLVSVREQAEIVVSRLRDVGQASFRELTRDAEDTLTVVARFLALLELYRERAVGLEQEEALGELLVRWTGDDEHQPVVTDEFDQVARAEEKDRT